MIPEISFSIKGGVLLEAVRLTVKAVIAKPVIPALANLRIDKRERFVTFSGSDGETWIKATASVQDEQGTGSLLVPARLLPATLQGLEEKTLTVMTSADSAVITWNEGQVKLPALAADEWPDEPTTQEAAVRGTVDGALLAAAIGRSEYACGTDDTQPTLQGLCLDFLGRRLNVVASNARKMSISSIADAVTDRAMKTTITRKSATALRAALQDAGETSVAATEKHATFLNKEKGVTVICRLMEGTYPNYQSVIPAGDVKKAEINKARLLDTWARMNACAGEGAASFITVLLADGKLQMFARNLDMQVEGEEEMGCLWENPALSATFHSAYLQEVVKNTEGPVVVAGLTDERTVMTLRSETYDDDPVRTLNLLMPTLSAD